MLLAPILDQEFIEHHARIANHQLRADPVIPTFPVQQEVGHMLLNPIIDQEFNQYILPEQEPLYELPELQVVPIIYENKEKIYNNRGLFPEGVSSIIFKKLDGLSASRYSLIENCVMNKQNLDIMVTTFFGRKVDSTILMSTPNFEFSEPRLYKNNYHHNIKKSGFKYNPFLFDNEKHDDLNIRIDKYYNSFITCNKIFERISKINNKYVKKIQTYFDTADFMDTIPENIRCNLHYKTEKLAIKSHLHYIYDKKMINKIKTEIKRK